MAATLDEELTYQPLISIVVPVYNTPETYLREAIDSVLAQVYPHWELCIADDCSPNERVREVLREYATRDSRIKLEFRQENGHIVHASNSALALATGEFVGLLDHDDLLEPHALYEVVKLLNQHRDADMIYTDEDKLMEGGQLCDATWKPAWCPESMSSRMYTCHFATFRRSILLEINGFRPGYEGSQDYDLVLRFTEKTNRVFHIPKVLYHWRIHSESAAASTGAKPYAYEAAARALADALERRGTPGNVSQYPHRPGHYLMLYQVANPPLVSIIIPFRDVPYLLNKCIESIVEKTSYPNYEIVLVDNGSSEPETRALVEQWIARGNGRIQQISVPEPFNLSRLNNRGAEAARGMFLAFFQSDMTVKSSQWLTAMVGQCQWDSIGAVGGMVWFGNETIQHVGIVLGQGDRPWYPYQGWTAKELGGFHLNQVGLTNNVSAVSGAGLVCRRAAFDAVGGFDEGLPVAYGDVDFCLRLRSRGLRNVYMPNVSLVHQQLRSWAVELSAAEAAKVEEEAVVRLRQTWGTVLDSDPCASPVWMGMLFEQSQTQTQTQNAKTDVQTTVAAETQDESGLPLVSICIPTYNGQRYLRAALDSAIAQTYPNIEIIVGDGGSMDRTVVIAREYGEEHPEKVTVYTRPQLGMVQNWNACAGSAQGKYIKFLHQDDELAPDCVEKMVALAEQDPAIALVFCRRELLLDEDATADPRCQVVARESRLTVWPAFENAPVQMGRSLLAWSDLLQLPINKIGEPSAVLMRRDSFEQLGGFDEKLCQLTDVDMWLRLLGATAQTKVGYVADPLARWRIHPMQATQKNIEGQRIDQDWQQFYNNVAASSWFSWLDPQTQAQVQQLGHQLGHPGESSPAPLAKKTMPENVREAITLIKAYSQTPRDPQLLAQVQALRQRLIQPALQLATQVRVTTQALDQLWTGEFATLHQALRHSGLLHESLGQAETGILNRLLTALPAVPDGDMPRLMAMLTVATLLRYPYQLLGLDRDWSTLGTVASRYVVLLLDAPDYFGEVGALEKFREYTEKLWRSLRIQVQKNSNDLAWQKIAQRLTTYGVITPLYFSEQTGREIHRDRAQIIEAALTASQPEPLDWDFGPRPHNRTKIRIGILRNYWLPGTESFSTLPVFEHLDRDRFEVVLYTLHPMENDMEHYCGAQVDGMVALPASLPDQVNAIRIADLDILWIGTNVTMVTNGITLLSTFRLGRIQVTSINSPTTTGFRNMDVYFGGLLSLGKSYGAYHETVIALPGSGICFSRPSQLETSSKTFPTRADWGAKEDTIVLISGANFNKLLPELRTVWTRILAAIPNAILVLYPFNPNWQHHYPGDRFRQDFDGQLQAAGVDPKRLVILDPMAGTADIRQCLRQGDLYLDSLPYGGATSLLDPIDVGLPMVVYEGDTLRFRQAPSLLRELGHPILEELIATTVEDYIKIAIALANSPDRRRVIAQTLINAASSLPPFMDSHRYSRTIAPIFETLVEHWIQTQLPTLPSTISPSQALSSMATPPLKPTAFALSALPTDRLIPNPSALPEIPVTPAVSGPAVPPITLTPALTPPQLQQLAGTLNLWRIEPNDPSLVEQVRQWRSLVADAWEAITPNQAQHQYQQTAGQAYQILLASGLQKLEWTAADKARLDTLTRKIQLNPSAPHCLGPYMVTLLYYPPGTMRIDQAATRLPQWLYPLYAKLFDPQASLQTNPQINSQTAAPIPQTNSPSPTARF